MNLRVELDFHCIFAISKLSLGAVEQAISVNWYGHEQTPAIILTLVLWEFKESLGSGDRNLKANMIASCLGGNKSAFLLGLLREIPGLVKEAGDVVVDIGARNRAWRGG